MIRYNKTAEQEAARTAVRDKIEALRVQTLQALREIGDFARTHECLVDKNLDEFAGHANRVADAIDTSAVNRAFFVTLDPIYEWEPDHGTGFDMKPCPPGEYGA